MTAQRKKFQKTSGYKHFSMYINYGHGDEGPGVWYSPRKLKRLTRLKRKWDPDQLFSFNNPVPLYWNTTANYTSPFDT